jgi:hypothetical protein
MREVCDVDGLNSRPIGGGSGFQGIGISPDVLKRILGSVGKFDTT